MSFTRLRPEQVNPWAFEIAALKREKHRLVTSNQTLWPDVPSMDEQYEINMARLREIEIELREAQALLLESLRRENKPIVQRKHLRLVWSSGK